MRTEARCAFERCQAGGVILAGAPRVEPWGQSGLGYHPGCWAALRQPYETVLDDPLYGQIEVTVIDLPHQMGREVARS